jgi:modulator of FtsH protease HflK
MAWNDNDNPWGKNPWGNNSGKKNNQGQDDLQKMWEESKQKFSSFIPPRGSKFFIGGILGVAFLLYAATGFYRILPDEHGVVMRFGKWTRTVHEPGLHYHFPYPIENVLSPKVTAVNRLEIGFRNKADGTSQKIPQESRMLTGDENFVDLDFTVFWVIKDAGQFLFNVRNQIDAIKAASESAMRDIIGSRPIQSAFTEGRGEIEVAVKNSLQGILDNYGAGVEIRQVALQAVDPPEPVVEAFNEVHRARTDKERMRNEAERYHNSIIPETRGEVAKIIQEAHAYREKVINQALGDTKRYKSLLDVYKLDKDIMRERLYIETLEAVLKNTQTILLDPSQKNSGPIPFFMQPGQKMMPNLEANGDKLKSQESK